MEPGFTQEELDKITLSAEQLEHYSKPDELKRLLLERNFYKKVMEKQIESINAASAHLNFILDAPISSNKLIIKNTSNFDYDYRICELTNKIYDKYNFIPNTHSKK